MIFKGDSFSIVLWPRSRPIHWFRNQINRFKCLPTKKNFLVLLNSFVSCNQPIFSPGPFPWRGCRELEICWLPTKNKNVCSFQRDGAGAGGNFAMFSGYFKSWSHQNAMTLLWNRLASFFFPRSKYQTLSGRGSQFDVISLPPHSSPDFSLFPTPLLLITIRHPHPGLPNPLLPILFRLQEKSKRSGTQWGRWKSTVFSFYLCFLCLIFRFLVVLISAICNSYI